MNLPILEHNITELVSELGDLGIFVAMFLESSIVPIPSEVVIMGAGAIGIPLLSIIIFGSLGSTIGGMVGYALGRYAALPVILKFGRYILIKPHHIHKAENFAKKYGVWSVLIGRIFPVVPFKVFSIAAGITNIPLVPFVVCTLIGVVPRIFILSFLGAKMVKYTKPLLLILFSCLLIFLAFKAVRMLSNNRNKNNSVTEEREGQDV